MKPAFLVLFLLLTTHTAMARPPIDETSISNPIDFRPPENPSMDDSQWIFEIIDLFKGGH